MSRKLIVVIVIPFILSLVTLPVLATHNLAFVVSVGDRHDYTLSYEGQFGRFDEVDIYMQIDEIPEIPDYVESLLDCMLINEAEYFFANGTEMRLQRYIFDFRCIRVYGSGAGGSGNLAYVPRCIPLGNLTFLGELIAYFQGRYRTAILASEKYWGFELEGDISKNSTWPYSDFNISVDIHADYSKEDGFLAHYELNAVNITSGLNYQYVSLKRIDLVPEEMNVVTRYLHIPQITPSGTSLDETSTLNPLIGALNILSISVWSVVIAVLSIDYRRRR